MAKIKSSQVDEVSLTAVDTPTAPASISYSSAGDIKEEARSISWDYDAGLQDVSTYVDEDLRDWEATLGQGTVTITVIPATGSKVAAATDRNKFYDIYAKYGAGSEQLTFAASTRFASARSTETDRLRTMEYTYNIVSKFPAIST